MSFEVGPLDTVVLDIYPTYLMITITLEKSIERELTCTPKQVCSAVREAVEAGIRQITSEINYVNTQHSLTFPCGCKVDHPGVLKFVDGTPHNLSCSRTNRKFPLPKGHELWQISHREHSFNKQQPSQPQQQHGEIKRLTDNHHSVLLKQLTKHAAVWREIGTYLGFTQGQLDNIQANQFLATNSPVSWFSSMLAQWLQWAPGESRGSTNFATLGDLKAALSQAGLGATAHDLGV